MGINCAIVTKHVSTSNLFCLCYASKRPKLWCSHRLFWRTVGDRCTKAGVFYSVFIISDRPHFGKKGEGSRRLLPTLYGERDGARRTDDKFSNTGPGYMPTMRCREGTRQNQGSLITLPRVATSIDSLLLSLPTASTPVSWNNGAQRPWDATPPTMNGRGVVPHLGRSEAYSETKMVGFHWHLNG